MKRFCTLLGLTASLFATACGTSKAGGRPDSMLAQSGPAQSEFRSLRARFFTAQGVRERARLEQELHAFARRFPDDERVEYVRLLSAWLEIDRKNYPGAQNLIARARPRATGSTRDFLNVVQAAVLTETGAPEQALKLLEPLDKKIIDHDERFMFGEQRVRASLAARDYEKTISAMLNWLAQAAPDAKERVQNISSDLLGKIPRAELVRSLRGLDQAALQPSDGTQVPLARNWLRKTMRERLTKIALRESDPELARNLLEGAPAAARTSESGILLGRIAASTVRTPLIIGRSIGLVLSVASPEARRRSARVAAGMSRALNLLGSSKDSVEVRLVTRDDAGTEQGAERALSELAGEGATILVAGVDAASSAQAINYAESSRIPVIVLATPDERPSELKYSFLLGSPAAEERRLLGSELERRALKRVAIVGSGGVSCSVAPSAAGAPRFPIDEWRRLKTEALLLLGDVDCAKDVLFEIRALRERPRIAVGLEASSLLTGSQLNDSDFGLRTGSFPAKTRPADAAKPLAESEPPLDWYEALGHDAAVLSRVALSGMPATRIEDAEQVDEMHIRAERALRAASAKLWSSEKLGFSGKHVLERALEIATKATVK